MPDIEFDAPLFPRSVALPAKHRPKVPDHHFPFNALVARPVGKKEIQTTPAAQKALDTEWEKLVKAGVWDEQHPREWSDLSAEARKSDRTVHVGRVF